MVAAIGLVALLMFGGKGPYEVTAEFQSASQLVNGNLVEIGGRQVGKVKSISLAPNGLARVKFTVDGDFSPLHEGTQATIRVNSLSGIANRYVSLQLGPSEENPIPDGGTIPAAKTQSAVDLDSILNSLDEPSRKGLEEIIRGSAANLDGKGQQANESLKYLSPALSTTSQLTAELASDQAEFNRFVTDTSGVVTTLASRSTDLSELVANANAFTRAIGDENQSLSQALGVLPDTLQNGTKTFRDLHGTLDDLDVLVNESKPATKKLAPFFAQLRPLLRDADPTIRDLSQLIRAPGANNDLIELLGKQPQLTNLAKHDFPRTIQALQKSQPVIDYIRPYSPELTGWLTRYGQSASPYDGNGHYARVQPIFNKFTFSKNASGSFLTAVPDDQRLAGLEQHVSNRCPGSATQPSADGSNPFLDLSQLGCNPSAVPPGP
ncbi:MAG TPA: MCE family protein [Thermoleophilaceae bacterium]|nr:MCE family protein [Thermoleophilaceae bacterium]